MSTKKLENMIGSRYGRLTIIEEAGKDKKGNLKWLCRCDCGVEKVIYQQSLRGGFTKSCGCLVKESTKQRMSKGWAEVFSKEFLELEHIQKKRTLREIGRSVGCTVSCVMKYMQLHGLEANDQFYDFIGKKFGKLTVISLSHIHENASHWDVICECGTKKVVQGSSLAKGNIVSCGCWNRERLWKGCGELSKTYWSKLIGGAKKRNLSFDITIEQAWELFEAQNRKCALSNLDISFARSYSRNIYLLEDEKQTASLDRIDSNRGYSLDNVQWVHVILNRMKSNLQPQDFVNWCQKVVQHDKFKNSHNLM